MSRPDEEVDLAQAALLIARDAYPELDIPYYLSRLDDIARAASDRVEATASRVDMLKAVNHELFVEQDFDGNSDEYSDPRNSYLNDVLDRRLGIPISLSVIYMEVARRVGVPVEGVSFPGHFLVKCEVGDGQVVIDPFFRGRSLSETDLLGRIRAMMGEDAPAKALLPHFLDGSSKRDILARMLRNLKVIFNESDEPERVLVACNRLLEIAPDQPDDLLDRADAYRALECSRAALQDYRRYLILSSDNDEHESIRARMIELESNVSKLH